jgi:hypothetical protein
VIGCAIGPPSLAPPSAVPDCCGEGVVPQGEGAVGSAGGWSCGPQAASAQIIEAVRSENNGERRLFLHGAVMANFPRRGRPDGAMP